MKRIRILQGACVEHWLDKRIREHKSTSCSGNYIKIPAEAWVKFQELKNKYLGKKQSLAEANRKYMEENHAV